MYVYRIKGGIPLKGKVRVSGSKNASLPVFAASLLLKDPVVIKNVPEVQDVFTMAELLEHLGVSVRRIEKGVWRIHAERIDTPEAPYEIVKKMRASIYVLAPLLLRRGEARVSLPGGCAFGPRPVNFHLDGLKAMGAKIKIEHGYIVAEAPILRGTEIIFDRKSVGATAHLMMAGAIASGTTILKNAAHEPEVMALADFLKSAGAVIDGAGTDTIKIRGVSSLNSPGTYSNIPDRIEAGTFLIASLITGGEIEIENVIPNHLATVVDKAKLAGLDVEVGKKSIYSRSTGEIVPVEIVTSPYPGFPTDMQAPFMAALSMAKGVSIVREEIYPDRFKHAFELNRLGANIRVEGDTAIIEGVQRLLGAPVMASDLRAGAALVLAGLAANGETEVRRIYHIDRGYEEFEHKLKLLGANIERMKV